MNVADFDYELPETAIAQEAIEPRDAARLLVASTLEDLRFSDLPRLLHGGDLLVVNRTRVRAARLRGVRADTGGVVEVLLTKRIDDGRWEALFKPARRLRTGIRLEFGPITGVVLADPVGGVAPLALDAPGDVDDLLPGIGAVPLPPYFRGALDDDERYQTIFAKEVGSAAAPTAALHFTPRLVEQIGDTGASFAEVELEVGLDTFRPMSAERVEDHRMHQERFVVPDATVRAVEAARREGGRVVAVGTTVVRALETAGSTGTLRPRRGESDLFITPGYVPRVIDAVITNFHAPRTTLIAMVAALLGPRWRTVYDHALASGYRFLSFGDAMFIDEIVRR